MRSFTVTWHGSAEDRLANLWTTSLVRNAITRAADEIESALRSNPGEFGVALSDNIRFVRIYPLFVLFRVRPLDYLVEVLDVRLDVASM